MDIRHKNDGWIEVICGSMFAGKTEELIRRVNRIKYAKKSIIVFKPTIDDRYDEVKVVSHNHESIDAFPVKSKSDCMKHLETYPYAVAFDEVQFFGKDILELIEELANAGVRVICAGLDLDFRGEVFGIMGDLLARAEYVTKLTAICIVCGAPATRTQRIINGVPAFYEDPIILVSGTEKYEARCRFCHCVPHKIIDKKSRL